MEHAVRELEKVVKAMSRKVIHLEDEITNIKVNTRNAKVEEPFKDTSDYINSTLVSTEKRCKKEGTQKKHNNLKHVAQQCKVCSQTLVSTIELLQHIAKEHSSNKETNTNSTESQDPEKKN